MPTNRLHSSQQHRLRRGATQIFLKRNPERRDSQDVLLKMCASIAGSSHALRANICSCYSKKTETGKEVNWPDHEVFTHLSDPSDMGDLSVGDAGETRRGEDDLSDNAVIPTQPVSVQSQNKNQNLHNHKANDKRRKFAPLDSIGRFQIPSSRNRKEKKHVYGEN
ncbi:hypothetical protein CRENBAI_023591 [Crenichthys baileyi]|uniref:Uncharacterized protein n=1 Tax=Crenichthys baileyi TaxID=28760 RepID=A0AAV9QSF0_9TELE